MAESIQVFPVGRSGAYALGVSGTERLWRYYHEGYCMTLVLDGFGYWRYRNQDAEVSPRGVMLMEPGEVHANTKIVTPGSFFAVFIDVSLVGRIAEALGLRAAHFKTEFSLDPELIQHLRCLRFVTEQEGPEAQEQQLLLAFKAALKGAGEDSLPLRQSCPRKLRSGRDLLAERYHAQPWRTVDIEQVAGDCGLSYHWFVHAFSEQFGVAPYQYVKALRMARARELMALGPHEHVRTVRDIAVATGYADASHMNREFKRDHGIRPGVLAKALNRGWRGPTRAPGSAIILP
jgi:AraC-like DNA-binding protein